MQQLIAGAPTLSTAVPGGAPREVLVFGLGGEEYGVAIHHVQELRGYERPTALANAPAYVKGVINLRGEIVPIVDLRVRLNLGVPTYDQSTTVIILEFAARKIGAVVDCVFDVVVVPPEQIKPVPCLSATGNGLVLDGVGSLAGRMLLLANMPALMALDCAAMA